MDALYLEAFVEAVRDGKLDSSEEFFEVLDDLVNRLGPERLTTAQAKELILTWIERMKEIGRFI